MNASDRRALRRAYDSKDWEKIWPLLSKPKHYKKPIQKAREAKEQKERLSAKEEVQRIRAYVFGRAGDRCEAWHPMLPIGTWKRCISGAKIWDHWLGGNGRRVQKQSIETTWALCPGCNDARTNAAPTAAYWNDSHEMHCIVYGYKFQNHIPHAALPRKSSRALGLGQRVPPSTASSPDARDLPKGPRCPFYEGKPGCDRAVCPKPPPCEPLSALEKQRSESP